MPEENLHRYRALASIARRFKSLGNDLSNAGFHNSAEEAWFKSEHFWNQANALRVDLD